MFVFPSSRSDVKNSSSAFFPEQLAQVAFEWPDRKAFSFPNRSNDLTLDLSYRQLFAAAQYVARELLATVNAGDHVILLYLPGVDYVTAFFGCLLAGVVPVPSYPPTNARNSGRIQNILNDCDAHLALTARGASTKLRELIHCAQWLELSFQQDNGLAPNTSFEIHTPKSDDIAFLQYTSGSTGNPKGVMVTHKNLNHNSRLIGSTFYNNPSETVVSWLPPYHDMGLIGNILQAVYQRAHVVLLSPTLFLQSPWRWLQTISDYRATVSGAPNFAYELCANRLTNEQKSKLDLSSWVSAYCGAEPIRAETVERFYHAFKDHGFRHTAFLPCYGLAEATLFVSGAQKGEGSIFLYERDLNKNDSKVDYTLVSSGRPALEQEVVIVDPDTRQRMPMGQSGEIWLRGESIAAGYWKKPELSREVFAATIQNESDSVHYLRTGDLGFLQAGELYINGRLKDLIILNGRNIYPQDVEAASCRSHAALRTDGAAAFAIESENTEQLIIVQELEFRTSVDNEIFACIAKAIFDQTGTAPDHIVLVKPGAIPRTSSGKIRRRQCRTDFQSSVLSVVAHWERQTSTPVSLTVSSETNNSEKTKEFTQASAFTNMEIAAWVRDQFASRYHLPPSSIDDEQPFAYYGLTSIHAVEIAGALEVWLGRPVSPTIFWDYPTLAELTAHLADETSVVVIDKTSLRKKSISTVVDEPIAIIGLSCRFPQADTPEAFWHLLRNGVDAVGEVPASRYVSHTFTNAHPDIPHISLAGFLDQVDQFDASFFGIAPHEAVHIDPQQRLVMEVAWEALENAAIAPIQLADTETGVFIGISTHDYEQVQQRTPNGLNIYAATGSAASIAANRLSYLLNLRGPSMAVDTACSSSLVAVHLACQSLRRNESELAIAGGVNVILSTDSSLPFAQAGMLSTEGRCKTFDANANGYVRGEGCGAVILKRLSAAQRDADPIHAIILGSATSQDGRSNGLIAPNGNAQAAVIQRALADANVMPQQIDYVEAHGTGTELGDPIELNALKTVLLPDRADNQPCVLGSVKTNIGHLEAAAGIAGLLKVVLALEHKVIPPHLHYRTPNPHSLIDGTPFTIPTQLQHWDSTKQTHYASVSSFGFGGSLAHVVLAEAPATTQTSGLSWPWQLLTFSAKTEAALDQMGDALAETLQKNPNLPLADIAYTHQVGRNAFNYRRMLVCRDRNEVIDILRRQDQHHQITTKIKGNAQGVVFMFPGQGTQKIGMAQELYQNFSVFRFHVDTCSDLLQKHVDWDLREILYPRDGNIDIDQSTLDQTAVAQPALFVIGYALAQLWIHWGLKPTALMGHSIGEYVAACLAGVFSLEDALALVAARGRLMQQLPHGTMLSVSLSEEQIHAFLNCDISLAAVNGRQRCVLSGDESAILNLEHKLTEQNISCKRLRTSHAFHSHMMDPILASFTERVASIERCAPLTPFISNVTGTWISKTQATDPAYWAQHLRAPVRFADGLTTLAMLTQKAEHTMLELGPGTVLTTFARQHTQLIPNATWNIFPSLALEKIAFSSDLSAIFHALGRLWLNGHTVDWLSVYADQQRQRVSLPSYPFQRERYWVETETPIQQPLTETSTDANDIPFWQAVETNDIAALSRMLQFENDSSQTSFSELLPLLSRWRKQQRTHSTLNNWRYCITWQPSESIALTGSVSEAISGTWLLIISQQSDSSLATLLAETLTTHTTKVITVPVSAATNCTQLAAQLREALSDTTQVRGVISLLALDNATISSTVLPASMAQTLALVQALGEVSISAPLWLLTQGAVSIGRSDPLAHPLQSMLWGLGHVIALEHSERWGGLIDLPLHTFNPVMQQRLLRILAGRPHDNQLALRSSGVFLRRLVRAPLQGVTSAKPYIPRGTILITGGTGGIGAHLARWLADQGAEHLVLTSRRGLQTPGVTTLIEELQAYGTRVTITTCDIADRHNLAQLLQRIEAEGPPLGSVFHAAGAGQQCALTQTNPDDLITIASGKVAGALHLHELLGSCPLDAFVLFSSIAGVLGSAYQGMYAAANSFLNALAIQRRALGLIATSVAWGAWEDTGMAEDSELQALLQRRGHKLLPPNLALCALKEALDHDDAAIAVMDIDWAHFAPLFAATRPYPLFSTVPQAQQAMASLSEPAIPQNENAFIDTLRTQGSSERHRQLLTMVLDETAQVLEHSDSSRLDPHIGFLDLGLDSLQAMKLRKRLQDKTGLSLPATMAFDHPSPEHVANFLAEHITHTTRETLAIPHNLKASEPIAIIGIGLQLPGSVTDLDALWRILETGQDTVSPIPADRWDANVYYDPNPDADGKSYVREAAFLDHIDLFDAAFFGINNREAKYIDPQHRLLLETAWQALECSGIVPPSLQDSKTGVFVGIGPADYQLMQTKNETTDDAYTILGTSMSFAAGRLAYTLGLQGPALSVDTACSSSLVALHLASQALRQGECDLALAAGVQVMSAPEPFTLLSRTRALASDGRSKTFSAHADGYGRGEGVVVLTLERLSDAQAKGRSILGIVRGSAVNHDGTSSGITTPNGTSQQKVLRAALADAQLTPADIDVVECHGTGTSLGDPIEVQALAAVYGTGRHADQPLKLGAIKTNIGHLESASGLAGIAKILAAFQHQALPPTLHTEPRNPLIDWNSLHVQVVDSLQPWHAVSGHSRRAGISAFGLSGTNAHVILEEAPRLEAQTSRQVTPPPALPLLLSGKTSEALYAQAQQLHTHLRAHPEIALTDLAYSLATTRTHFAHRAAIIAGKKEAFIASLEALATGQPLTDTHLGQTRTTGKLVVLFTGQGSQRLGMGQTLYEHFPVFRETLDYVCAHLDPLLERPLLTVLFAAEDSADAALLDQTAYTQPALFALEVALFHLITHWGVQPDLLIGHSVGEIAAAHVAGVFSLADACTLIAARGRLMQALPTGGAMIALEASAEEVLPLIETQTHLLDLAAINGPRSVVISGNAQAAEAVAQHFQAQNRRTIPLTVSHAFHSPLMEPMLEEFERIVRGLTLMSPRRAMISNVTGKRATEQELTDPLYWVRHVRQTVHFLDGVRTLETEGINHYVELGPDGVLSALVPVCLSQEAISRSTFTIPLRRGTEDITSVTTALAQLHTYGQTLNWSVVFAPFAPACVALPTYAFQRKRYWLETEKTKAPTHIEMGVDTHDQSFWQAVDNNDISSFSRMLKSESETLKTSSFPEVLPLLSRWREQQRTHSTLDSWRYRISWQPLLRAAFTTLESETIRGTWLLVTTPYSTSNLQALLTEAFNAYNATVITLVVPAQPDRTQLTAQLRQTIPSGIVVRGVISLLALDDTTIHDTALPTSLAQTLTLVQALGETAIQAPLWLITQGAVSIGRSDSLTYPLQSMLWGFGRVVALEHSERWGGLIDLPVHAKLDRVMLERLLLALSGRQHEDQLALRSSGLFLRRLEHAPLKGTVPVRHYTPRGTILITGGTGGIGAHLARWLAAQGAEHLVLISRRGLQAPGAAELLEELHTYGTHVTITACDITDRNALAQLLQRIESEGPSLRSVFHAVGVGQQSTLDHTRPDDLVAIANGKVAGALHLHELLGTHPLDAFVLFSSIAAAIGSSHQSIYAAANTFLDALAEQRRAQRLPATSVSWGAWAGAGMAEDNTLQILLQSRGQKLLPPDLATIALKEALDHDDTTITVMDVEWARFAALFASTRPSPLLSTVPQAQYAMASLSEPTTNNNGNAFINELLTQEPNERRRRLLTMVLEETAHVLEHLDNSRLDPHTGFLDLGLDSLQAMRLRKHLQDKTGLGLPATLAFDHPSPEHVANFLAEHITPASPSTLVVTNALDRNEPIAIIGVGLQLPGGATDLDALWRILETGQDTISSIPIDRWDANAYYDPDPDADGKSYVRDAAFLDHIDLFDAAFFGINNREAKYIDPQHRLLLEAAWQALERSGIVPSSLQNTKTGVFAGIGTSDYQLLQTKSETAGAYTILGTSSSFAAGRLAYTLGLQGPALSVDTACSSSLVALHLASQALRQGECDLALAAGVQVMSAPEPFTLLSRTRALASDGRSKTFSANADGYGRGEGVVVLTLERLSDAQAKGRSILGVIRGSAVNHDGTSSGITTPNGTSQQKVLRAALADAQLTPADIDVVECHGTGTSLGDPIEVQALAAVYGTGRHADQPLKLGAIKTNIGHLESASGLAGIAKILAAFQHQALPPTLHTEPRNPLIDWNSLHVQVVDSLQPWHAVSGHSRRAGISAFGLSGTNAHVILEEAPRLEAQTSRQVTPPPALPLLLSGKTSEALYAQAQQLHTHLRAHPEIALTDLAYSLATTRTHFAHRAAIIAGEKEEFIASLEALATGQPLTGTHIGQIRTTGKLAVLFTGQGNQRLGMGQTLYEHFPVFREALDYVCAYLDPLLERPLLTVMFAAADSSDTALLHQTAYTQPALFALEVALFHLITSWGIQPDLLIGHSVGEIAAAHVAGVFSLADACTLIAARGRLMQALPTGGTMIALEASSEEVLLLIEAQQHLLDLAAINGPRSVVIAGDAQAAEAVAQHFQAQGRYTVQLTVSHAFHSPLMQPMLEEFERVVRGLTLTPPRLTMISNVSGKRATEQELTDPMYWVCHVRQTVRFLDGMRTLEAEGVEHYLEVGPDGVLSALAPACLSKEAVNSSIFTAALRKGQEDVTNLITALTHLHTHGQIIDWSAMFAPFVPTRIALPTYAFQRERYWIEASETHSQPPQMKSSKDTNDIPFWQAVETNDVATLSRMLRVEHETLQTSFSEMLPLLSRWREQQRIQSTLDSWRYRITWQPLASTELTSSLNEAIAGTWLLITSDKPDSSMPALLAGALMAHTGKVSTVPISVTTNPAQLTAQLRETLSHNTTVRGVISLLALNDTTIPNTAIPASIAQTLTLVQALGEASISAPLWLLTHGAVSINHSDPLPHPLQSMLWGLGHVIALEHSESWGGLIDLPAITLDQTTQQQLLHTLAGHLQPENQLALRSSGVFLRRLVRAPLKDTMPTRAYIPHGTILITGGTGGIGAHLARWLATQGAEHLVLTSRRGLQAPGAVTLLEELKAHGTRVTINACDVADRHALTHLLQNIDAEGPALSAVFHAAGAGQQSALTHTSHADLLTIASGKVAGALHLHELLGSRPLDAFVLFSSVTGVLGNIHQGMYAAANSFLDALAVQRRLQGFTATSVAWGAWAGAGMAEDNELQTLLQRRGHHLLPPDLAIAALQGALDHDDIAIAVMNIDWAHLVRRFSTRSQNRILSLLPEAQSLPEQEALSVSAVSVLHERPDLNNSYVAARTPTELQLTEIWKNIFGIKQIGIYDNFLEMGGDSLLAMQLLSKVNSLFDIKLLPQQLFENPTIFSIAVQIDAIKPSRETIATSHITALPRPEKLPLSFAQQRLWFIDQLEGASASYNLPCAMCLEGEIEILFLEQAFHALLERHETLRTIFPRVDGSAIQYINAVQPSKLPVFNLDDPSLENREARVDALLAEETSTPFDLSKDRLIRARLIRLSAQRHIIILTIHHIISDGWSLGILMRELITLYTAFAQDQPSPLPPLPIQYADFTLWQHKHLQGQILEQQLGYWKDYLTGAPALLELPTNRPRPAIQTYRGSTLPFRLDEELTAKLRSLGQREGVTLYMSLLAIFSLLLARYSNQSDIVIGSPIANRHYFGLESLIGLFANTLALRTRIHPEHSFHELLMQVRRNVLGAATHQDLPFEKLVDALNPSRSLSYSPLVQVMLAMQNSDYASLASELQTDVLRLYPVHTQTQISRFDLMFELQESSHEVVGDIQYNTDLFDRSTIERLYHHFLYLIKQVVASSTEQQLRDFLLPTPEEQHQILAVWNHTATDYPTKEHTLHQCFETQVRKTPHHTAVIFENHSLTYDELNIRANQLAHYLIDQGIKPDQRVGLCIERSIEMIVSLLAILKAGAAYVPLDPQYPAERLANILRDADIRFLITQQAFLDSHPIIKTTPLFCIDCDTHIIQTLSTTNLDIALHPQNLAYCIYTSGSTGQPKGVAISHEGIVNRLHWMQDTYDLQVFDRVLQKTPFSFDVSVWEFFWPLIEGATLVFAKPMGHQDPHYLMELIEREAVTTLHFVPPMLDAFLSIADTHRCQSMRQIMCSGETLPFELQERFFTTFKNTHLHNLYGPTEASVDVSYFECHADSSTGKVPIGRPIANTELYILDAHLSLVPVGIVGELFIGGIGLARGYLNRPDLTAEKFIPNPFKQGERLYRTGDLARFLPDGNIEYLGRIDHQVKIRGFRIELGEIEATLMKFPEIHEATVLVREDQPSNPNIVAYVVAKSKTPPEVALLRETMRRFLPEYMIPTHIIFLDALPLTTNGKVDRKALPAPERQPSSQTYVVPDTPMERTIADAWAEILELEYVGSHDNFFDLGGNSLLAIRLHSRLTILLERELQLVELFQFPTVASLAQYLTQNQQEHAIVDEKIQKQAQKIKAAREKRKPLIHLE